MKMYHVVAAFAVLTFIIIAVCIGMCVEQVDDTEACFKVTLGKYDDKMLPSGLTFYNGIITDIVCLDARMQQYDGNKPGKKDKVEKMSAYTKDLQEATLRFYVNWQIDRSAALTLYRTFKLAYADRLASETDSAIKQAIGQYDSTELIAKRGQIEKEATEVLQNRLKDLNLKAESIRLRDIEFSDEYERAIEKKRIAEKAAEQERDVAARQVEKETNVTKVEQQKAEQRLVKARADAEAVKIKATAEAEAIRLKTESLRQAQSLLDYERVQIEKIKAQQWKGELPQSIYAGAPIPFFEVK